MIDGAERETRTVASTPIGALGATAESTGSEASEGVPAPAALVAVTMNECSTPLARPAISQLVALVVQVRSGEVVERTAYPVTAEPLAGAESQEITMDAVWSATSSLRTWATTPTGAPGTP